MAELGPLTPSLGDTPHGRLAAALRLMIELAASGRISDEGALEVASRLEELTSRARESVTPTADGPRPSTMSYLTGNPVSGVYNALAAPLLMEVVAGAEEGDREIRATVTFDRAHQGPPGLVHGGHVAAALDDCLGMANFVANVGALTGTLTVRYLRPTPLGTPLRVEARYVGRDGRKLHSWAGIYSDDTLLAEADGLFIELRPDYFTDTARPESQVLTTEGAR